MTARKRIIKLNHTRKTDAEAGIPSARFRRLDLRQLHPAHSPVGVCDGIFLAKARIKWTPFAKR
jgi:hypothetical protein